MARSPSGSQQILNIQTYYINLHLICCQLFVFPKKSIAVSKTRALLNIVTMQMTLKKN